MDDEEFEDKLNREKSFIDTTKNHTEELETQLEEEKEKHKVRDEIEREEKDYKRRSELAEDILTEGGTGILGALPGLIIGLVTIAILFSVGLIVLGELRGTIGEESTQFNSSGTIDTVISTVPTWIGIIIIVALASIVLSFIRIRD